MEELRTMISEILEEYENTVIGNKAFTGLFTGYFELDYKTGGFQKGELILLSGTRKEDKFPLALNIVHNMITKENIPTAIFSMTLSKKQILKQILAIDLGKKDIFFNKNFCDKEHVEAVRESCKRIAESPLFIENNLYTSLEDIKESCLKIKKEKGLGFVVIDCAQLLGCGGIESETERNRVIGWSLKELAQETNCPVLLLSDTTIDAGGSKAKEIMRQLEKESIDRMHLNQYADLKLYMYSSEPHQGNDPMVGIQDVMIEVERNDSIGKIQLIKEVGINRFLNMVG